MADNAGYFSYLGQLKGHSGWVTSLATPMDNSETLISASRDKTLISWSLARDAENQVVGTPKKSFEGHSNFISDVAISSDGMFALTGSWDCSLRLWEIATGQTTRKFTDHTKDVLSVAFSPENRQIVSGGRDCTVKVWNTLGECKYTIKDEGHTDWVSCVRFSPNQQTGVIVSAGWDKMVKVWNLSTLRLQSNLAGHKGYVNTVTVSPDGSLCASGGKDGTAMLWDLTRGEELYQLESIDNIHSLTFSPNRYWLCAATEACIKIWDLESKSVVAELVPELPEMSKKAMKPECISLCWSPDGNTLYSGYTDNAIRVWGVQG
eukprot:NODE_778_length_1200_cov_242.520037_g737_i0.p1 GENE.NODE_778_length_1200_cov_242.520037_g737_i0~~NODE_778_length_1200_cov_242.520037_g737_i0.p1  ORF type:complete len:320 (+),score=91.04 NODE_778_length_1200_cov_242.520037_g737_i0:87-1046(+)